MINTICVEAASVGKIFVRSSQLWIGMKDTASGMDQLLGYDVRLTVATLQLQ